MLDHSRSKIILGKNLDKLKKKTIAIIGVGGTGHIAAQLLTKYPFKKIILMDFDEVHPTNLERQVLYTSKEIGKPKVVLAAQKLKIDCDAELVAIIDEFKASTAHLLNNCDLIVDCCDNIPTRLVLNDFCKKNNIPWVYSGAIKEIAAAALILPDSFCFTCFNQEKVGDRCKDSGVMNYAATQAGVFASSLTVQYLAQGKIETHMLRLNLATNEFLKIPLKQKKNCPTCNGTYKFLEK